MKVMIKQSDVGYNGKYRNLPCTCLNCGYVDLGEAFEERGCVTYCPKCFSRAINADKIEDAKDKDEIPF